MATKTKPVREIVYGKPEMAGFFGVGVTTVYQWQARGLLPEADLQVGGFDAWYESTLKEWGKETNRTPAG